MRGLVAGVVIVLFVLWVIFYPGRQRSPSGQVEVDQDVKVDRDTTAQTREVRFIGENPFTEDYGKGNGSMKRDLEALRDVVTNCQSLMKNFDTFHLPGNPEIVRFLQGSNPEKLAWIPEEHPLIQSDGVLLDRYGTPVFFHRLSGLQIEYRSAGPDRKHWTDDDIIVR